ncbi:MAG: dephospho-CoA kinase [Ruminococcaceae bacterium]|nr:dephospho-CoA kinase [Oscillospiraceae bacterium]
MIFGLTGPTGAGKGTACHIFAKYGVPCVDTDRVYHTLLKEGGQMVDELTGAFGADILSEGTVNTKKLGAKVFGHPDTAERLHILNTITHKYVIERTHKMIGEMAQKGVKAVLIDAPQLFEAKIENECDLVIAVLADTELRLARILDRDSITREMAIKRINAQKSDTFFREHCHHILENNGDLATLEAQIRAFLNNQGLL